MTDHPLINDPFAEPLVRAVGVDLFTRLASGELRPSDLDSDDADAGMQRMTDNMAIRTKFFDEFFLDATAAGIRQAVILASGLDSRAYRLPWPAGTTVYEIDQPDVIDFKTRTLADIGAEPTADRRTVAIDLRNDWPTALTEAGFDPNQPTAWSAEGLLGYLPPEAQDRLLDTITALSAPGSRFATESGPNVDPADQDKLIERMQSAAQRWRDHGFDLDIRRARLPRRPQRCRALPRRPRLAGHRQQHQRAVRRQRPAAVRRRHPVRRPALYRRRPRRRR